MKRNSEFLVLEAARTILGVKGLVVAVGIETINLLEQRSFAEHPGLLSNRKERNGIVSAPLMRPGKFAVRGRISLARSNPE
jgi:hypothetical protein